MEIPPTVRPRSIILEQQSSPEIYEFCGTICIKVGLSRGAGGGGAIGGSHGGGGAGACHILRRDVTRGSHLRPGIEAGLCHGFVFQMTRVVTIVEVTILYVDK